MPGKQRKSRKLVNLRKPEKIIGKRCQNGCPEVLVKWQGYADKDSTWEPLSKMGHCIQLISDYEASVYLKAQKTQDDIVKKPNIGSTKVSALSESSEETDDEKPLIQLKAPTENSTSSNKELFTISNSSEDEDEDEDEPLPQPKLQHEDDDEHASTSSRSSRSTTSTSSSSPFNFSCISSSSSCSSLSPNAPTQKRIIKDSLLSDNCQLETNAGVLLSATCINMQKRDHVRSNTSTTIENSINLASKKTGADLFSPNVGLTEMNLKVAAVESFINLSKELETKSSTQNSESKVIMNQINIRLPYKSQLQSQKGQSNPTTLLIESDLSNSQLSLPTVQPITQSNQNKLYNNKNKKEDFELSCEPHYCSSKLQSMPNLKESETILGLPQQTKINTSESIFDINQNNTQNLQQLGLPQHRVQMDITSTFQSVTKSNENELNNIKKRKPPISKKSMPDLEDNDQIMSLPRQQIGELFKVNINQNKMNTTQQLRQLDPPQYLSQQISSGSKFGQFLPNETMSEIEKQTVQSVTKSNQNESNNRKRGCPLKIHQKLQFKTDVEQNVRLLGQPQQRKICKKTSEINVNQITNIQNLKELQTESKIGQTLMSESKTKVNTPTIISNTKKEGNNTNNNKSKRRLFSSCQEPHEQNGRFFSLPKIPKQVSQFKGESGNNKMSPISSDSLMSQLKNKDHQLQLCTSCLNQNIKYQSTDITSTLNSQVIGDTRSPSNKASSSDSVANSSKFDSWRVPPIKRKGPYGMQRGLELEKVIHHFFVGDKLFLFVKWMSKTVTDAVLIETIRDLYPIPIINYFEKLEICCDFDTNKY